jgi:hypothetical protein
MGDQLWWTEVRPEIREPVSQAQLCGSPAGYKRHRAAGEKACDACLQAESDRSYKRSHLEWDGKERPKRSGRVVNMGEFDCANCGHPFQRYVPPSAPEPRFCSGECAGNAKIYDDPRAGSKASTRARKLRHAETWDGVTDRQVYERDGWICQIPGCELGPIDPELKYPHPLSAEPDHVVPLSLGGTDTAPNKRAAHRICNQRRGNRMHPDDVPVITVELAPLGLLPARLRVNSACPVHGLRKPAALPWPKVALYRPCRWCGDATRCARPSRSPWTVCPACSHGTCVKCGADMAAVVNSSPPEQRVCQMCQRAPVADGAEASLWWTTARP